MRRFHGESSGSQKWRKACIEGNTPNSLVIFCNDQHKVRYEMLEKRKIVRTRYMDDMVLTTLGMKEDVDYMIDRARWTRFISMRYPIYIRVTLKFLSSLEVQILQGVNFEEGKIQFRIFNVEYEWTLAQFASICGLPVGVVDGSPIILILENFGQN